MDINGLFENFSPTKVLNIGVKVFGLTAAVFYTVFAIVIIRQVQVMKRTVTIRDWGLLSLTALVQLGLGLILLIYALLIL